MCGIAGFIGKSKNPILTYNLISKLFEKIESRGKDASGFWGLSDSEIFFHKESTTSSEFIASKKWTDLQNQNLDLLICHAREASKGVGGPENNENNHPFVSDDLLTAVIHNGRIPDSIYFDLKKSYQLKSNCDSELFLRMFEPDAEKTTEEKTFLIKKMWENLFGSHMAVMIGEKVFNSKRLWVFRNEHRNLQMFDATDTLGQIFFVSTQEIWDEASNFLFPNSITKEIETEKIYLFELNNSLKIKIFSIF